LVPIVEPYGQLAWNDDLQVSGHWQLTCEAVNESTSYDYQEYWSSKIPRTREDRMRRRFYHPLSSWSPRGLLALLSAKHWQIAEDGEVESTGSSKTGRTHYRIRKVFVPYR
jgi:hypothetical protein